MKTIKEAHDLAAAGIRLYAINRDPLTASAVEVLFKARKLPLTEPQRNAQALLSRQMKAYEVLFTEPLM